MGLLDGVLGAIGGLLGFAGQQSANEAQQDMLERQIEWQREVLQNKVQWNVADMRAAGLNPMLAAMSPSSGSAPSASAPQVGNVGSAAVASAGAIADIINNFRNTDNNTRKTDSEIALNSARAQTEEQQANFQRALLISGYPEAQTAREIASAKESTARISLMFDQRDQIRAGINKIDQEIKNLEDQRRVYEAQITHYMSSAKEAGARAALAVAQKGVADIDKRLRAAQEQREYVITEGERIENVIRRLEIPRYEQEDRFFRDPRVRKQYDADPWSYRRDKGYTIRGGFGPSGIYFDYGLH